MFVRRMKRKYWERKARGRREGGEMEDNEERKTEKDDAEDTF